MPGGGKVHRTGINAGTGKVHRTGIYAGGRESSQNGNLCREEGKFTERKLKDKIKEQRHKISVSEIREYIFQEKETLFVDSKNVTISRLKSW